MAFGVMHIINVAHGDIMILAAFMIYWIFFSIPNASIYNLFLIALLVPAVLALIGYIFQRYIVNRLIEGPPLSTLLLFFGLMLVLPNAIIVLWGPYTRSIILPELSYAVSIGLIKISLNKILTLVLSTALIAVVMLLLQKSRIGIAIRATAQNREGAVICGVNIKHIYSLVLAIAFFLEGFAGFLIAINYAFTPVQGVIYTLFGFLVVVLGGMGYLPGAVLAGILIGLLQAFISSYLGTTFAYAIIFLILYLTLLLRPRGLLGRGI